MTDIRYTITHNSHGFALVREHGDPDEAELLGTFPTRIEAVVCRDALLALAETRALRAAFPVFTR
jgi:hypothetical protein